MIQAPSRYARIIRTVVPFGAICGLGYLFLITFIPDHFGPTARQISKNELVNVNVVGNVGFMEGIGAIGRALIGEGPQETSQLDYHTEISETDDGSVYNSDLLPDAQQNVLFEKESYGYIIDNIGVDKDSNVQINQSIDTHLNIQESDQEQNNQIERGQPESQDGYQPRQSSLDEIGEQDDSPLNGQETHNLDSNNAFDLEDDSDEDYAPASSVQEEHLVDQDILSEESVIYEVEKANGVLVILTHEDELQNTRETIRQVEDRFNRDRNYPWVVLSPLPLTARSQNLTKQLSKGVMTFGIIPYEQWSLPKWIDATRVRNNDYAKMKLGMNRTSLLTRHKWRYMSGFVAQHELLDKYEFFWRVDPGVEIFCDVEEDPMLALKKSGQKFAWSLSSAIDEVGVPGAWSIVQKIKGSHRNIIPTSNDEAFLTKESRDEFAACTYGVENSFSRIDFFRSPEYQAYFNFIDQEGPIYYEKWNDATVMTIGLSLLMPRKEILFLKQHGWRQDTVAYCPKTCPCNPKLNNLPFHLSCTPFWMGLSTNPEIERKLECKENGKCAVHVSKPHISIEL